MLPLFSYCSLFITLPVFSCITPLTWCATLHTLWFITLPISLSSFLHLCVTFLKLWCIVLLKFHVSLFPYHTHLVPWCSTSYTSIGISYLYFNMLNVYVHVNSFHKSNWYHWNNPIFPDTTMIIWACLDTFASFFDGCSNRKQSGLG